MTTSRREILGAGLAAAGAAMTPDLTHAQEHDHGHDHDHQTVPSDPALRVKALESLLVAKGLVDRAALDALVDTYEHKVGPRNGARVVARAWVDRGYKQRLLTDGTAAIAELGYGGATMIVVENTEKIHNLVVCTLCSCYPWGVLGLPMTTWRICRACHAIRVDRSSPSLGRRRRSPSLSGCPHKAILPGRNGPLPWRMS
jgi:hypothetical protein